MTATRLPDGYATRPATMDDVAAATELYNACEIAETGEPDYDEDELRGEWAERDLPATVELVIAPDGSLAGSMALADRQHVVVEADGYVHPNHGGRGIGTYLVRRSELRAREHIALAPADAKVVLRNYVNALNPEACRLLDGEAYHPIRYFLRMEITNDTPPQPPVWPDHFTIRTCVPGQDERAIYETVQDAFRDHWSMGPESFEAWMKRLTGDGYDPTLWFQVFAGEMAEPVAVAVCRNFGEKAWVNDIGVRRPWRRRGLAEALLRHAFGVLHARGIKTVDLGVDAENPTGATRLYERVGMTMVRRYATYEKVLKDGKDWHPDRNR